MINAVGRDIPEALLVNGKEVYQGKNYMDGKYLQKAAPKTRRFEKPQESKIVATLVDALKQCGAKDGMTFSFHHHLRDGDYVVNMVMKAAIEELGLKDLTIAATSLGSAHDPIADYIEEGKVIGITGRSGSGKSTLLKLFMRFWPVTEGKVTVSGKSVDEINTENLRDMESFVTQQTHLFHDSIRKNLCIAKLDATEEEIIAACKKASVHDFIMGLPKGYDIEVGELGDTLSGGERQRVGLARAFLHNAPFLLLDEPTSNLDSLNEAVILKALQTECQDKTVILVSHRKSTMGIADTVYSVERGRLS